MKDCSDEPPGPGRNGECDFMKTNRFDHIHASTTDENIRLYRKGDGQENHLPYFGYEAAMRSTENLSEVATLGAYN